MERAIVFKRILHNTASSIIQISFFYFPKASILVVILPDKQVYKIPSKIRRRNAKTQRINSQGHILCDFCEYSCFR